MRPTQARILRFSSTTPSMSPTVSLLVEETDHVCGLEFGCLNLPSRHAGMVVNMYTTSDEDCYGNGVQAAHCLKPRSFTPLSKL